MNEGIHSGMTKEETRQILPPRACKTCILWFRTHWAYDVTVGKECERCGLAIILYPTGRIVWA